MAIITHFATAILAAIYLLLGVFLVGVAQALWWPFGAIVFVLAAINIVVERRRTKLEEDSNVF